ncbi:MAG: histone-lysine N-methyltransferase [Spirochaetales bacterium]|nr:histone-lysine N-methyltransferase [Spirochaetales bacterium]
MYYYGKTKNVKEYSFKNVLEPNLFRDIFPYDEPPRLKYDNVLVPLNIPDSIWITDTTFRDGQQAHPPFTVKQIVTLYNYLYKLGGKAGVIRQCEFFLYSDKDRKAVEECLALNYQYPEVTGWIRAVPGDFKLVKAMGLKETGILTSASDYHIYLKLKSNRGDILDKYLGVVKEALSEGIIPRCHFEDITRSDIYGFSIPFAQELMRLREESKINIKIRLCDTMGYGDPSPAGILPRSVPKIVHALVSKAGVPSECLEWHGHNDFHKVHANSAASWLYGCASINSAIFGIGERTGNSPLESLIFEYISIKGNDPRIDTTIITELAHYFESEIYQHLPYNYPFVGKNFNVTRAGIHADGVIKNEEIYNIFNTQKLLNRPIGVLITDKSGIAGIAWWLNSQLQLPPEERIDKHHPGVKKIYDWVTDQYEFGRIVGISDEEMTWLAKKFLPDYFESDFDRLKQKVQDVAESVISPLRKNEILISRDEQQIELLLQKIIEQNPFIQLIVFTDPKGQRMIHNITQVTDKDKYLDFTNDDFTASEWFKKPVEDGKIHVTDLYVSRFTERLCITVSTPVWDEEDNMIGIIAFDIKFEEAVKL